MKTLLLSASNGRDIARAGQILRRGGTVAIPTETVYGLAADGLNEEAVSRIFIAKGRPQNNPLILHIADAGELEGLCAGVTAHARRLAERFWPGPLTIVLRKNGSVPDIVTAGLDTVAVRCPAHPAARDVIACAGKPLAAPSANISGRPSPTSAGHVLADFDGEIDAVLDGGPCEVGIESTVVDLTGRIPVLLRPGGVTEKQLRSALGDIRLHEALEAPLAKGGAAKSPGLAHRHYAPRAPLTLLRGTYPYNFLWTAAAKGSVAVLCSFEDAASFKGINCVPYYRRGNASSQAAGLFDGLRRLDESGAEQLYALYPEGDGLMAAVRNRLLRAADFHVIEV